MSQTINEYTSTASTGTGHSTSNRSNSWFGVEVPNANNDFEEWYKNHKSEYDKFLRSDKKDKAAARKDWERLRDTYSPIIQDLQGEYDNLTKQTGYGFYRPELGYSIQSGTDKAESIFGSSTRKLFGTKAGRSMVSSSGINKGLIELQDRFENMMDSTVYNAYSSVTNKISGVRSLQDSIESDIREYERKMI